MLKYLCFHDDSCHNDTDGTVYKDVYLPRLAGIRTKSPRTKPPGQNPPKDKIPPGQNPPRIFHILLTVIYFINSSK